MARRKTPEEWQQHAQDVIAQMARFNIDHPHATWDETEDAVDAALAGLRQAMLAESVQGHALADFRGAPEQPKCPACAGAVQAIGQHHRQVQTRGDTRIAVERTRGRCSACGAEFFPPG
jgi:hypothetical protein